MRIRTALVGAAALLAAAGSLTPALAATGAGVVKGSWTATATPDPTGDTPEGSAKCQPVTPTARATKAFVVPGPGILEVSLNNSLDWSGDIRNAKDGEVLADADSSALPTDVEIMSAT